MQAEISLLECEPPIIGLMRSRLTSSASNRLRRIRVARPQGDPSGIKGAERYRMASLID